MMVKMKAMKELVDAGELQPELLAEQR